METLVVGAGDMGRWVGQVLSEDVPRPVHLTYFDENTQRAESAAQGTGGQVLTPQESATFDVVCIAVPIPVAGDAIAMHAERADGLLCDVTGTMTGPIEGMATHAPNCERMSLHPLFAPANEPGNVPVAIDRSGPLTEVILEALSRRDNRVFETTAAEHDEMMQTVQARTHAAVLAYALATEEVPSKFQTAVSETLTGLVEEVTDGQSRVYADIQAAFDGADEVARAAAQIAEADSETFEQLYEDAGR